MPDPALRGPARLWGASSCCKAKWGQSAGRSGPGRRRRARSGWWSAGRQGQGRGGSGGGARGEGRRTRGAAPAKLRAPRVSPTPPPRALPNLAFYGEEVGPSGPGRPGGGWGGPRGARPGPARAGQALGAPGLSARPRRGPETWEARSRGHVSLSLAGLAAPDNGTPPHPSAPGPWAEAGPGPPRPSRPPRPGLEGLGNGLDRAGLGRSPGSCLPGVFGRALHPLICPDRDAYPPSQPGSGWASVWTPAVWTQIPSGENLPLPSLPPPAVLAAGRDRVADALWDSENPVLCPIPSGWSGVRLGAPDAGLRPPASIVRMSTPRPRDSPVGPGWCKGSAFQPWVT